MELPHLAPHPRDEIDPHTPRQGWDVGAPRGNLILRLLRTNQRKKGGPRNPFSLGYRE